MNAARPRSAWRGVSLVELMVVLTLVGITLTAVAPSVSAWVQNLRIRGVAEAMQSGLQQARMEAMRRNQAVRFSLVTDLSSDCTMSSSARTWVISMDDPSSGGQRCASTPSNSNAPRIIATYAGGEGFTAVSGVTLSAVRSDTTTVATSVVFDGLGRVSGTGGIARISINNSVSGNDFRPLRVVIADGGGVRMCDPQIASNSTDPRRC